MNLIEIGLGIIYLIGVQHAAKIYERPEGNYVERTCFNLGYVFVTMLWPILIPKIVIGCIKVFLKRDKGH